MLKRTVATLASGAVLALLITPSAQAAGPEGLSEYGAGSSATALMLSLLGEELAISATTAAVGSTPEAAADGAALLVAGSPVPGAAPSSAPEPANPDENEACPLTADLDEATSGALSALELEIACVRTAAAVADGAPSAQSVTDQSRILVTGLGGTVLEPVLGPLFENVDTISEEVITALDPIFQVVEDTTQVELDTVLTDIIADLDETEIVLAEIVVGASASRASATDTDGVVGEAGSNAVTINLFPELASQLTQIAGLDLAPTTTPLLSVVLASSNASAVANTAGEVDTSGSAAQLASIAAADELGIIQEITGQLTDAIDGLAADQLSCQGGALADVICFDLGGVFPLSAEELAAQYPDLGAGAAGVRASAADVAVLPILSEALGIEGPGVLGVSLSASDAAAFAVPAETPAEPESPRGPLPRTGGGTPGLPVVLGLFGAAAVGVAAIRRTRNV